MTPTFSVIIPHYNRPQKLQRLLDTIPDIDDIEVLVIDDISTTCIEEYKQLIEMTNIRRNNVNFFNNDIINKSPGGARNVGIEKATGKWLIFADSDDFFLEHWYEIVKKYSDSEAHIIYFTPTTDKMGNKSIYDREFRFSTPVKNYIDNPAFKNEWRLKIGFVVPWSRMIKRSTIIDNDLKFTHDMTGEDTLFSCKLNIALYKLYGDNFSIEASSENIYCFTQSADGLDANRDATKNRNIAEIVDQLYLENLPKQILWAASYDPLTIFLWRPYLIKARPLKWLSHIIRRPSRKIFEIYETLIH